jgi:ATP-dependent DNA helicase RecQ
LSVHAILQEVFGYGAFRGPQQAIIEHVTGWWRRAGVDAHRRRQVAVLPGSGHCPPGAGQGITVVISPLIALMHDQVGALHEAGVNAAFLNSTLSGEQASQIEKRLLMQGDMTLLVLPRRSGSPHLRFLAQLDSLYERGMLACLRLTRRIA